MARLAPPGTHPDASVYASLLNTESALAAQSSPLSADIANAPGVGPRRRAALRARRIGTLADALAHLPYRYEDLRRRDDVTLLRPGTTAVLEGVLQNIADRPMPGRWSRRMATGFLRQPSGKGIRVLWFNLHSGSLPPNELLV